MRIIAIGNQKGGVGKTATTQNLGYILAAEHDLNVLLVDVDPQSSLTESCNVDSEDGSIADVLSGQKTIDGVLWEIGKNLKLAPSNQYLADVEAHLFNSMNRENKLKHALKPVKNEFDICLIDCPPSLSLMTINALSVANELIIPCTPQMADVRGLLHFLDTVEEIQEEINPELKIFGILPTFYDSRLIHHSNVVDEMKKINLPVLSVSIGRSIRIAEAASAGESISIYDPANKQLKNYRKLAKVIVHGK